MSKCHMLSKRSAFIVVQVSVLLFSGGVVEATDELSLVHQYAPAAARIQEAVRAGHDGYAKLQELCDDIGHRMAGSRQLEDATHWAADRMRLDGQENVRLEPVTVPWWVRGRESCVMTAPREAPLAMVGLGYSVGTPLGGVTAEVEVVRDEAELEALGAKAKGKIVLFNNVMPPYTPGRGTSYGTTVRFRGNGARLASEHGAVACLVRSVTAHSLRSPHTGMMRYGDAKVKIPAAALSVEDAEMIARLRARDIPVTLTLKMEAQSRGEVASGNVIGELRGTTFPDEIVVIGGRIDSWAVGQGAHDDGAGVVMAMETLNVLRKLGLRPKRTIRVVLWTAEEIGLYGAKAYAEAHADELDRHVAALEADIGGFAPTGYGVDCKDEARQAKAAAQMREILRLCKSFGNLRVTEGHSSADVSPMKPAGVVVMGHNTDPSHYFDYHHTHADTLDKIDPEDLTNNIAVMATVAYVLADMPRPLGEPVGLRFAPGRSEAK